MDKELPFVKVLPPVVCPCPALPEGMVVVSRKHAYAIIMYEQIGSRSEEWLEAFKAIRAILKKKP